MCVKTIDTAMGCHVGSQNNAESPYAQAVKKWVLLSYLKKYFIFVLGVKLGATKWTKNRTNWNIAVSYIITIIIVNFA